MILDFSAELVVAIASGIVALIALAVAVFDAHARRKHNKLSVKPLLSINRDSASEGYTHKLCFELRNMGVGPAILKQYSVFFDDIECAFNLSGMAELFREHISHALYNLNTTDPGSEKPMAPGESFVLVGGEFRGTKAEFKAFAARFGFKIEYQSIYQDETFFINASNAKGFPKNPASEKIKRS